MTQMFSLGITVATKGVLNLFGPFEITNLLTRHILCDWGDLGQEDKALNDAALLSGQDRIFSAYNTSQGKVWIITEHDRSLTTVLLPAEY